MDGKFILDEAAMEEWSREGDESWPDTVKGVLASLKLLPVTYMVAQQSARQTRPLSVSFTVALDDIADEATPLYHLVPSKPIERYDNRGGLGVILCDSAPEYVCVSFDDRKFVLDYRPKA